MTCINDMLNYVQVIHQISVTTIEHCAKWLLVSEVAKEVDGGRANIAMYKTQKSRDN